jgi:hypothetical protein
LAAQLTPPVRSWLLVHQKIETVRGEDGQFEDAVLLGYDGFPDFDTAADAAILAEAMTPATIQTLAPLLADLWEATSHAQSGGDNLKLKFAGYAKMLEEFPADVAVEAIERWSRREQWWPSRSQLLSEAQKLARWRSQTLEVLRC